MEAIQKFDASIIKDLQKFTAGKNNPRPQLTDVVYLAEYQTLAATDGKVAARVRDVILDVDDAKGQYKVMPIGKDKIALEPIAEKSFPYIGRVFPDSYVGLDKKCTICLGPGLKKEARDLDISLCIRALTSQINYAYLLNFPKATFDAYERQGIETGSKAPVAFKEPEDIGYSFEIMVMPFTVTRGGE